MSHSFGKHFCGLFIAMLGLFSVISAQGQIFVVNEGYGLGSSNGSVGEYNLDGSTINASLISGLSSPYGIAISGSHIFVASFGTGALYNGTIGEYNLDGTAVNASLITGLDFPFGIAVSGTNLFVTNSGNDTIGEYTPSGATINAGLVSGVAGPLGIAVSGSDLFVVSTTNGTVGEYTTSGATVNASLISGLNTPDALTISGTNLFVNYADTSGAAGPGDGGGGPIGEYTTSGATVNSRLISGPVYGPGIGILGSNVYISTGNTINEYDTSGNIVNPVLISGLNNPAGIVVIDAVPEPSTYGLLLGGLVLLALWHQRQRRLSPSPIRFQPNDGKVSISTI